jgi:serine phosphatase RsbU (regulator of sigma subunit)
VLRYRWLAAPVTVLAVCLMITAAVTAATAAVHRDNEQRLLEQQTAEAAAVIAASIPAIEAPLVSAAKAAEASDNPGPFAAMLTPSIDMNRFIAAVLLTVDGEPVAETGEPTALLDDDRQVAAMISQALGAPGMAVTDSLVADQRRIGYAYATTADTTTYVVYAESGLPEQRTGSPRSDGVFSGLDFALYLDGGEATETLLYTSVDEPPITGRTATETLPFGDRSLTLVMSSDVIYGGTLAGLLPWIAAIGGSILALIGAAFTDRLLQGRRHAEALARTNSELYEQQRSHTDTLRRSLLPRRLPSPDGLEIAAGYWPADASNQIGGDFYDIFHVRDNTWAIVIGDVCGQGIDAAALTGLTRHTIRAAARHLRDPGDVLTWVHEAVAAHGANTYCTVCFAFLDIDPGGSADVLLALGGHPAPILIRRDRTDTIGEPGTILGLIAPKVHTTNHRLERDDIVVFYTDGITDAPGGQQLEHDELHQMLSELHHQPPNAIRDAIRGELAARRPNGNTDDTAVLIIRATPNAETTDRHGNSLADAST